MALTVEVVKPLDAGRVQVDAKRKIFGNDIVRHFDVPKEKADDFISDYKKEMPKNRMLAASAIACLTLAAGMFGASAAKKAGAIMKIISATVFGGVGFVASTLFTGKRLVQANAALFEKHDARPIFYLKENMTKEEVSQEKMDKIEEKK